MAKPVHRGQTFAAGRVGIRNLLSAAATTPDKQQHPISDPLKGPWRLPVEFECDEKREVGFALLIHIFTNTELKLGVVEFYDTAECS